MRKILLLLVIVFSTSSFAGFLQVDPGLDYDPNDPMSFNLYAYVRNNPVNATDPTGMRIFVFTDGNFTTTNDGVDEVMYLDNSGEETTATTLQDTDGNNITQHDFLDFVATTYQESDPAAANQNENSAIASVVTNRAEQGNLNISETLHNTSSSIYGASGADHDERLGTLEGTNSEWIAGTKKRAAVIGVTNALTGGTDHSNGAYFWESTNYLSPTSSDYRPNSMFVTKGWGTTQGTISNTITFQQINQHQTTIFMIYNPAIMGTQVWP